MGFGQKLGGATVLLRAVLTPFGSEVGAVHEARCPAGAIDPFDFDRDNDRTDRDTVPQSEPQMEDGHRSENYRVNLWLKKWISCEPSNRTVEKLNGKRSGSGSLSVSVSNGGVRIRT